MFTTDRLRPVDLDAAASLQWGSTATAVAFGDHLYDWRAEVGGEFRGLDLRSAVREQYGPEWDLVHVGLGKDDWRALDLLNLGKVVVPLMLVAADRLFGDVSEGLSNFRSVLERVQRWYERESSRRFEMLQPLVAPTTLTSEVWNLKSVVSDRGDHRWDLFFAALADTERALPRRDPDAVFVIAPFTGPSEAFWLGAGAMGRFAILPPRATSVFCPQDDWMTVTQADATYAAAHELGHAFGLLHTADAFPDEPRRFESVMEARKLPEAILTAGEVGVLTNSGYFAAPPSPPGRRRPARPG
jgi:hypothetical protein